MNTKTKIVIGMFAGIVAGAMLVGTAVAAPRTVTGTDFRGYGMMRSFDTAGTFDVPTFAEMNAFMRAYRTSNGSIDFGQMRADVTSGKVTPPCFTATSGAASKSSTPSRKRSVVRPSTMMRGYTTTDGSTRFGMMGSTY